LRIAENNRLFTPAGSRMHPVPGKKLFSQVLKVNFVASVISLRPLLAIWHPVGRNRQKKRGNTPLLYDDFVSG
jgi:hypothetical protein